MLQTTVWSPIAGFVLRVDAAVEISAYDAANDIDATSCDAFCLSVCLGLRSCSAFCT